MATRLYYPSTGAAAVSPAFDAWSNTAIADRIAAVRTKITSAMTNKSHTLGQADVLLRQYVSEPMAAQTISGTVKCYVRGLSDTEKISTLSIRVCNNAGTAFTGTLLALNHYGNNTNFATSLKNNIFANGDALSSLAINANDRLVIELGTRKVSGSNGTLNFGDDSGTDLPENETETAAYNPWIEFSGDLWPPAVSIAEALALADALAMKMGKALTEAMTLSDALALMAGKSITDAIGLTDAVSTVLVRTVSITEALSILDALSMKVGKPISETVTLTETISAMLLSLPTRQDYFKPRPLVTLTVGAATKRYSTETFTV